MKPSTLHSVITAAQIARNKIIKIRSYLPDYTPSFDDYCELVAVSVLCRGITADELDEAQETLNFFVCDAASDTL